MELRKPIRILLNTAIKTMHPQSIDQILNLIERDLTARECSGIKEFLEYCKTNNHTVDPKSLPDLWDCWVKSKSTQE